MGQTTMTAACNPGSLFAFPGSPQLSVPGVEGLSRARGSMEEIQAMKTKIGQSRTDVFLIT